MVVAPHGVPIHFQYYLFAANFPLNSCIIQILLVTLHSYLNFYYIDYL